MPRDPSTFKNHREVGKPIGKTRLILIEDLPSRVLPSGGRERWVKVMCPCDKIFEHRLASIIKGKCYNCGCGMDTGFKKHGLTHTQGRRCWAQAKSRCFNKNNPSYSHYGGRGITMYTPWINDLKPFYDYITQLKGYGVPGLSLDRRENDGNYEPGNLRWATKSEQALNRRKFKRNGK